MVDLPITKYPYEVDTWSELYRVYNSSESTLFEEVSPFDRTIKVQTTENEKWGDTGLLNINGEVVYYQGVKRETGETTLGDENGEFVELPIWILKDENGDTILDENGDEQITEYGSIDIVPVGINEDEVWTTSGEIKIKDSLSNDEYIVYSSVERDTNAKVKKLCDCIRPIAWQTNHTNINTKVLGLTPKVNGRVYEFISCVRGISSTEAVAHLQGSHIRGFVMAEHHNSLALAIIEVEKETLDLLNSLDQITDISRQQDECPVAWFTYQVTNRTDQGYYTVQFEIFVVGDYSTFTFYFGDGELVTGNSTPTHVYSPSSIFNPTILIKSNVCTVINSRETIEEVVLETVEKEEIFDIDIQMPEIVDIPEIEIPDIAELGLAELVFPEQPDITLSVPTILQITILSMPIFSISITLDMPTMISLSGSLPTIITIDFSGIGSGEAPDCVRIVPCIPTPT